MASVSDLYRAATTATNKHFSNQIHRRQLVPIFIAMAEVESGQNFRQMGTGSAIKTEIYGDKTSGTPHSFGIMQIQKGAAKDVFGSDTRGFENFWSRGGRMDVYQSMDVGVRYYKKQLDHYRKLVSEGTAMILAIAAYNGGMGTIDNALSKAKKYNSNPIWKQVAPHIVAGNDPVGYTNRVLEASKKYGGELLTYTGPVDDSTFIDNSIMITPSNDINLQPIEKTYSDRKASVVMNDSPPEDMAPDFFKIGDIVLRVPPQAISIQESNSISTISTVRTTGSPKINIGHTEIFITVQCTFVTLDEINGYFDKDGKWYGGLRGILAEYMRTPFVPLENETIRKMVYPEGFVPYESMNAFNDHIAAFNDEIASLRTMYDDMKKEGADVQYIAKMINDSIKFRDKAKDLYEQEFLKKKEDTMQQLADESAEGNGVDDSFINKFRDKQLAVVLHSFNISTVPGASHAANLTMTLIPFNYEPFSTSLSMIRTDDDALTQCIDYNMLRTDPTVEITKLHSTLNPSDSIPFKKYYRAMLEEWQDAQEGSQYTINGEPVYKLTGSRNILKKFGGSPKSPITLKYSYTKETRESLLLAHTMVLRNELNTYMSVLREASSTIEKLKEPTKIHGNYNAKLFHEKFMRSIGVWWSFIPKSKDQFVEIMKQRLRINDAGLINTTRIYDLFSMKYEEVNDFLTNRLKREDGTVVTLNELYEVFDELINTDISAAGLPVVSSIVDLNSDDRAVTGISMSYTNKVTPLQMVGHRYPTYQYMGGSDINVSISIQTTDEDLLTELRRMALYTAQTQIIAQAQMPDFRDYIDTSAQVECDFINMFGINRVSVTDVSYSNEPDHPGLYNVTLQCVQSDFDLKGYEAIVAKKGVTPALLAKAVEILRSAAATGNRTWLPTSRWEQLSQSAYELLGDREVGEHAKELERHLESFIKDEKELLISNVPIEGAPIGVWMATEETKKAIPNAISTHILYTRVRTYLENPFMLSELNDPTIKEEYEKLGIDLHEERLKTTTYPDMNLPILDGKVVSPDFYFMREPVGNIDMINTEMEYIKKQNTYKLMTMLSTSIGSSIDELEEVFNEKGLWREINDIIDSYVNSVNADTSRAEFDRAINTAKDAIINKLELTGGANTPSSVGELAMMAIAALQSSKSKERVEEISNTIDSVKKTRDLSKGSKDIFDEALDQLNRDKRLYSHKMAQYMSPDGDIDSTMMQGSMLTYGTMTLESEINRSIIQAKALETRKDGQMLQMGRAYPTFKLYFIEEDAENWLLFDDFYGYSAVKSIDIVKSRKSASDVAVVRVSNVMGNLTDPMADYIGEDYTVPDTMSEQRIDKMMLRVGCPIMIKMGYNVDPSLLDTVFYGAIAELHPGNGEIEFTAQGWGAQLNAPLPIKGQGESIGVWDWRKSHGDIITWGLCNTGMKHMGNKSLFEKNNDDIRYTPGSWATARFLSFLTDTEVGNNNTRDDNIYLPYNTSWNPFSNCTFDWRIDGGTTIWELIQEILLWYPGWIATILPYESTVGSIETYRSTLYIGPRDGFYKYTDDYNEDWMLYQSNATSARYSIRGMHEGEQKRRLAFDYQIDTGREKAETLEPKVRAKIQSVYKNVNLDREIYDVIGLVNSMHPRAIETSLQGCIDILFNSSKQRLEYVPAAYSVRDLPLMTQTITMYKPKGLNVGISCLEFARVVAALGKAFNNTPLLITIVRLDGSSHVIPLLYNKNCIKDRKGNITEWLSSSEEVDNRLIILQKDGYLRTDAFMLVEPLAGDIRPIILDPSHLRVHIAKNIIRDSNPFYLDVRSFDNGLNIHEWFIDENICSIEMDTSVEIKTPQGIEGVSSIVEPSVPEHFFDVNGRLLRCFRPVSNTHFIDSYHHILNNNIVASVDKMANKVIMTFPKSEPVFGYQLNKINDMYEITIDDDIEEDHLIPYYTQVKNIDTNWYANSWAPYMVGRSNKSHDIKDKAVPVYIKVANNILNNQVMDMYDGNVTIVGDPTIKPWDTVYIYDFENSMNGPIQVEQVIHHFSEQTGFVTVITPDLVTHCNDMAESFNQSYMSSIWPKMVWGGIKGAIMGSGDLPMTMTKFAPWLVKGAAHTPPGKWVTSRAIVKSATAGASKLATKAGVKRAIGAIPVAGYALSAGWVLKDIISGVNLTLKKEIGRMLGRQPITITPLMLDGTPMVAGLEGMRYDNVWVHTEEMITKYSQLPGKWISYWARGRGV